MDFALQLNLSYRFSGQPHNKATSCIVGLCENELQPKIYLCNYITLVQITFCNTDFYHISNIELHLDFFNGL